MARRAGMESLTVDVVERLRADILNKRLAPGSRLKPAELGARFQVSTTVAREALNLLATQDLVHLERNRAYYVMTLSTDALTDLVEARTITEGAALRRSIERGGISWESEVLAAHHRMTREPLYVSGDPNTFNARWGLAHAAFHHKLVEACGNRVLLDMCARLSAAAEVYQAWSLSHDSDDAPRIHTEHEQLMKAALAHDTDLAVALFERHVEHTRDSLHQQEVVFGECAS
ncbi:GntR family transcriptional regulator [Mycolicibacterium sp. CBM1]